MGASTKIQDTNLNILESECSQCSQCQQSFTEQDKTNRNWELWWDTSDDDIECLRFGGRWKLSAWVREITHKDCPEAKEEVAHA
ncbi:MAG: hypothetical protein MRECE_33c019 [Mycoplasmataceae bacterium CE_OT135]|nr:MAG: hypothetical protein MRECE_33c019 [Mycoplasmataceae bacterium CE_OT135]